MPQVAIDYKNKGNGSASNGTGGVGSNGGVISGGTSQAIYSSGVVSGVGSRYGSTPSSSSGSGNTGSKGSSGGGGVVYVNSGGGGSYSPSNNSDDILNQIKALLKEQQEAAEAAYKAQYEQELAANKQAWENNRNQINKNYMKAQRYINNMYGDAVSGQGLSNRNRNYQNWNNNLTQNQLNYTNNDATALTNFNMNKSNAAKMLAQGYYNYVLPVYTNRQTQIDDYDYRKYLAAMSL